jgi:23S rRNA U2552 (ribose-2'-O)-methylase RlmE/FtsJ
MIMSLNQRAIFRFITHCLVALKICIDKLLAKFIFIVKLFQKIYLTYTQLKN